MSLSSFDDPHAIAQQLNQRPRLELFDAAESLALAGHGARVTYSRKVFIPLTKLCRDVCHYCTFAETPGKARRAYLSREEILQIARAGVETGCREALFTLGDNPEARYPAARAELDELGHPTTLSYLAEVARLVMIETGLLPHLNPGLMGAEDYRALRPHSASMGIMLESASERLCLKGGPHYGSPDKEPARRIASIAEAGKASVPFTTGLLIGIGETRLERIESLLAIRALHAQYGHIQEVIIQNFRAKPGTLMAGHPKPSLDEHLWTIAAARLILGAEMSIQAPPNLRRREELAALLRAGVNDWGGVSPVTPDHVNPEAPWPHLEILEQATTVAGRSLIQRLAIGPAYARNADKWTDPAVRPRVLRAIDARGLPITDGWAPGRGDALPELPAGAGTPALQPLIMKAMAGQRLDETEIAVLFEADGDDLQALVSLADRLRQCDVGETITFVVNRNINYTNMCLYKCGFCAFAKGSTRALRGPAYRLDLEEIARRAAEAVDRGATEVCCQGGIHPDFTGQTYLDILAAIRKAAPGIHIHAFSPLEVTHGAQTLGLSLRDYLCRLKDAGLASLPGTAAEILHSDVRAKICPDKLSAEEWLDVMRTAHAVGLRSTATIMFGHVDTYTHWARHLELIRSLQEETGGFTEFVPLPFVHMESPMARKGQARSGPSYREAVLMHAISRIVLGLSIRNIQVSWVKMGAAGAAAILNAGANDMGGVLMDESITRAAGGQNGQMLAPDDMEAIAAKIGRPAAQRTTFYQIIEHDGALHRA